MNVINILVILYIQFRFFCVYLQNNSSVYNLWHPNLIFLFSVSSLCIIHHSFLCFVLFIVVCSVSNYLTGCTPSPSQPTMGVIVFLYKVIFSCSLLPATLFNLSPESILTICGRGDVFGFVWSSYGFTLGFNFWISRRQLAIMHANSLHYVTGVNLSLISFNQSLDRFHVITMLQLSYVLSLLSQEQIRCSSSL